MDCFFDECVVSDSLVTIRKYILENRSAYLIVVDRTGAYIGLLSSLDVITDLSGAAHVSDIYEAVTPVDENMDIRKIKDGGLDIIPVINEKRFPVGVLRLKNILPALKHFGDLDSGSKKMYRKNLSAKYTIDNLIGSSAAMNRLKETIIRAATIRSTVLILGETGVGKELVAQSIANLSNRRFKPFVRINCAAIPENLLESELFGYEEGAYTGAGKGGNIGKFELADGGTMFMDEIGDMQMIMQSKILRVLQEGEIERVGGRYPIAVDVRVIAATHNDLEKRVEEGLFRRDLFYRLNVIPIIVPPLREHIEDMEELVLYYLEGFSKAMGIARFGVEPEAIEYLRSYHWPGNIRELKNTVERLTVMTGGQITLNSVRSILDLQEGSLDEENSLKSNSEMAERETIQKYLKRYKGNKNRVADELGVSRSTLYNKLKKYQIK
jgi:transcriptional regulator with PAS, ATPase and Fis domain